MSRSILAGWAISGSIVCALTACGSTDSSSPGTAVPTDPPVTEPVGTEPPITEPAVTEPPATDPPVTEPPATEPPATEPPITEPAPTTEPPPAIVIGTPGEDGVVPVTVDGAALAPLFDRFVDGEDPYFLVHTEQEDIFIGVELYSVFGDQWTGQLGTFPTDCTTHGICVYFDPDGTGPLVGGGPGTGTITINQLSDGSILTLDDVEIDGEDGTVYRLSGVTLQG